MNFTIKQVKVFESEDRSGEPYKYKDKVYIHIENESILENLVNRRNRPSDFYKKEVLPAVLEAIQDQSMANTLKSRKWGWRQKCGCHCPCSPGFISSKDSGITVYATVSFSE